MLHPTIQRLEKVLDENGRKKSWFCTAMRITTQNYNNWRTRGIPPAKILNAANVIGVTREWLEGTFTDKVEESAGLYSVTTNNIGDAIIVATTRVMTELQNLNLANEIAPDVIGNMVKYAYENDKTKSKKEIVDNIIAFIKIANLGN